MLRELARRIIGPASRGVFYCPWRDLKWRAGDAVIRYGAAWAGVPVSIRWRGREWLRSHAGPWRPLWFDRDRGRSLQSAMSMDFHGEGFNPTEAGRADDFRRIGTTSEWRSCVAENGIIRREVSPAFWRAPGAPGAVNTTDRGGYLISTRHHWTQCGDLLTLDHLVRFYSPRDHDRIKWEIVTIYAPGDFSRHYTWQGDLVPRAGQIGEGPHSPIMSTPNGSAAIGLWSEHLPRKGVDGYGNFWPGGALPDKGAWPSDTNKINAVWREREVSKGPREFVCRAYFGTLAAVAAAVQRRH